MHPAMGLYRSIENVPLPELRPDDVVAIKLHMGERGNHAHVKPEDVRVLVSRIQACGGRALVTDTTTLYQRHRATVDGYLETARLNGFTEETIGAPVVIADADGGQKIGRVDMAKGILGADVLIVFSHATGHITTGFAGAIKNVAMGCVTKDGKRYIHSAGWPRHNRTLCQECGECAEACPFGFIKLADGVSIDLRNCPACERCLRTCKHGGLWRPPDAMETCYLRYAETCRTVMSCFDRVLFINEINRVTRYCDCSVDPGPLISPDRGFLAGDEPVAIDRRSAEIIMQAAGAKEALEPKWSDFIGVVSGHL